MTALREKQVRVFFVTHLYEFAAGFSERKSDGAMFLRAEREEDGSRTFRMLEGHPMDTSYGQDLYNRLLGPSATP